MPAVTRLIKKISSHPSTEELILFIADDDELVKACLEIQKLLETGARKELDQLAALCRNHHISLDIVGREIRQLLAIFAPDSINDEYTVLGLEAGADPEQVKQAFRRLSIRYHPDSSGGDTSEKFIKICQAYKTIISQAGHDNSTSNHQNSATWHYKKKRGPSQQQKRKNIILFSTIAAILFVISVVAPFIYKKKVMLTHLNKSTPLIVGSADKTVAAKHEQQIGKTLPQIQQTEPVVTETDFHPMEPEPVVAVTDNFNRQSVPESQNLDTRTSEPHPVAERPGNHMEAQISSPPQLAIVPQLPVPPVQKLTTAHLVPDRQQPARKPVVTAPAFHKKAAKAITPEPRKDRQHPEIRVHKAVSPPHRSSARKPVAVSKRQQPETINSRSLNTFIHNYATTYENKNFQQFAAFFTSDALENGHSFSSQHDKYIKLFQSVDDINLNIGILSSAIKNKNITITGRFKIGITYPKKQPFQRTGQIFFLLTESHNQYKVKELRYTFDNSK
jgi:DnaJ-domain-containing protein 1